MRKNNKKVKTSYDPLVYSEKMVDFLFDHKIISPHQRRCFEIYRKTLGKAKRYLGTDKTAQSSLKSFSDLGVHQGVSSQRDHIFSLEKAKEEQKVIRRWAYINHQLNRPIHEFQQGIYPMIDEMLYRPYRFLEKVKNRPCQLKSIFRRFEGIMKNIPEEIR